MTKQESASEEEIQEPRIVINGLEGYYQYSNIGYHLRRMPYRIPANLFRENIMGYSHELPDEIKRAIEAARQET